MDISFLKKSLKLPVIGAPLFIISNPDLVVEQCKAGVVGSFPALNARPKEQLDDWLYEINEKINNFNKTSSVNMNNDNKLTSIDSDLQDKEITPKLFASDETSVQEDNLDEFSETHSDKLFDQENNEDEDFEIPAFLRKQKF